jgi:hypothetical protein
VSYKTEYVSEENKKKPKDYDHKRASVYFSNKTLGILKKLEKLKEFEGKKRSAIIRKALIYFYENSNDIPATKPKR